MGGFLSMHLWPSTFFSWVKELWGQIFLKKQITNQQITEEFVAGILVESKDPKFVDWVSFATDNIKKY